MRVGAFFVRPPVDPWQGSSLAAAGPWRSGRVVTHRVINEFNDLRNPIKSWGSYILHPAGIPRGAQARPTPPGVEPYVEFWGTPREFLRLSTTQDALLFARS